VISPPRDFHKIPRQRLHPADLYHMIDWLRDGWDDGWDETCLRYARLKWHVLEMPECFHEPALAQIEVIGRAMLVQGVDRASAFSALRRIVSEWGRSRSKAA